jgi:2-keto-4-pentenoate hydratase/2-oxohepta-3-ene-1,7-dioic acid hydratase in catechol pathway
VRFGDAGVERPGLIDDSGRVRDLSSEVPELSGAILGPASIQRLRALPVDGLPLVPGNPRLGPCVAGTGKFVCVGLNYLDHVRETGAAVPSEPVLFMKATSAITGPNDPIVMPPGSTKIDWEVELGVVIGSAAKNVGAQEALAHVAGYCIVNDVSERAWQLERAGQWVKGKSADTFGPIGPWLVTADEVPDPHALGLWLSVNGAMRQNSNTDQMIFHVDTLVAYISTFMSLQPGDIISTGTPPGVGLGAKPPSYLNRGDVVRLGIAGLGEQCQTVL